jgi:serine/threonine-protein kinase
MGQVYLAQDESLTRHVAVKTLELDGADPSAAERFRREARTTALLTHPNIVTVFDTGTDDTTAFLVMELLPGPSLQERLTREGRLPVAETARVGAQMAAALAAAHAAGVVHRDVKPSNVVYAAAGQVKVLDFGIARMTEAATAAARLTQTAMVIGTAAYLSPEQASGGQVGPYSDLYALGCVLFALLTGSPPFAGDSPVAVCSQHLHAEPPDLAAICPQSPPPLTGLIGELLRKDPAARPRDAAAVAGRLAAVAGPGAATITAPSAAPAAAAAGWPQETVPLAAQTAASAQPGGNGMTARLPGPPYGSRNRPSQRVLAACLAAGVLLAALVAVVTLTGGSHPSTPGTPAPSAPATVASQAPTPTQPAKSQSKGPGARAGQHPGHGHGHGGGDGQDGQ